MIASLISWWRNRHRHVWEASSSSQERTMRYFDPNHRCDGDPAPHMYPYVLVKTFWTQRCECGKERYWTEHHNEKPDAPGLMFGTRFNGPFD